MSGTDDAKVDAAAQYLRSAHVSGPVKPLRGLLAANDVATAYRVQAANTRHWVAAGRRFAGWKIGLTTPAARQSLGADKPVRGALFADTRIADGGRIPSAYKPLAEVEIAFILGNDVTDANDLAAAIATTCVAIEIADTRIIDWQIALSDMIADNAAAAWFVLGSRHCTLAALERADCSIVIENKGRVATTAPGTHAVQQALHASTWLADSLLANGARLQRGDTILTGALAPPMPIEPGDVIRVTVTGLGECGVSYPAFG